MGYLEKFGNRSAGIKRRRFYHKTGDSTIWSCWHDITPKLTQKITSTKRSHQISQLPYVTTILQISLYWYMQEDITCSSQYVESMSVCLGSEPRIFILPGRCSNRLYTISFQIYFVSYCQCIILIFSYCYMPDDITYSSYHIIFFKSISSKLEKLLHIFLKQFICLNGRK